MTKYSLLEKIMLGLSLAWLLFCLVQVYRLTKGWKFSFQFKREQPWFFGIGFEAHKREKEIDVSNSDRQG